MNELISKTTIINALKGYKHFEAQFELPYSDFIKDFFSQNLLFFEILRSLQRDIRINIYYIILPF